jgi:hypothetical protein
MDEYIVKGGLRVSYVNELFWCCASSLGLVAAHLNLGPAYYRCATLSRLDQQRQTSKTMGKGWGRHTIIVYVVKYRIVGSIKHWFSPAPKSPGIIGRVPQTPTGTTDSSFVSAAGILSTSFPKQSVYFRYCPHHLRIENFV